MKFITKYQKGVDVYSDGVEHDLLQFFKQTDAAQLEIKIRDILNDNPNWPTLYHLSPIRENILSWFNFNPRGSLLEIGAGCGAITGLLCTKTAHVSAVELSSLRSEIIAHRHADKKNLTVYAGNLNDIDFQEKFDYVTLIGVLEYAGKYTHTHHPFLDFLKNVKKYLRDGGSLIVAIENRFGLKYWSGAKEDHTGRFFDSIEGYPIKKGVQTFGKHEISQLMLDAGFSKVDFYYPMPDYKLPTEIFSDHYHPSQIHQLRPDIFPFVDLSNSRQFLFDERRVMDNIIKNKQFDFFANSFLVFAR